MLWSEQIPQKGRRVIFDSILKRSVCTGIIKVYIKKRNTCVEVRTSRRRRRRCSRPHVCDVCNYVVVWVNIYMFRLVDARHTDSRTRARAHANSAGILMRQNVLCVACALCIQACNYAAGLAAITHVVRDRFATIIRRTYANDDDVDGGAHMCVSVGRRRPTAASTTHAAESRVF